ncbi:hypothetical protein D9M68_352100 [compost metagenome]
METVLALIRYGQAGAFLEYVVDAPHAPHALGEVRIEVAVEDGIACGAVAVAGTAVGDLIGVARARAYTLGIHVVGVVVIGVEQPLVAMQVIHVLLVAHADVADFDEVADVAVGHVGRLGGEQRHTRLDARSLWRRHFAGEQLLQADIGRHVHQRGDVADGVGTEEELLEGAGQAVVHGADAQAIGHHFGADAAGAVVDHEGVAGGIQHMAEHRVQPEAGESLGHGRLVMEGLGEVAERFQPVGQCRIALAIALQHIGRRGETTVGVGPHDDGVAGAGDDLVAVEHGQDR